MTPPPTTPTIAYATPEEFGREHFIVRPVAAGDRPHRHRRARAGHAQFLSLAGGIHSHDSHIALVIGAGGVALGVHQLSSRPPRLIFSDAVLLSTIGDRLEIR